MRLEVPKATVILNTYEHARIKQLLHKICLEIINDGNCGSAGITNDCKFCCNMMEI